MDSAAQPGRKFAYMAGEHEPNSPLGEPYVNENHEPSFADSFEISNAISARGHHFGASEERVDESRICLVDSACTSCMHSRRWREAYKVSLPEGFQCKMTTSTKIFHFANGSQTASHVPVWEIPIFLGGRLGMVHSAEVPDGSTPLLLSIPAMTALDMVIHMQARKVQIRKLDIEVS